MSSVENADATLRVRARTKASKKQDEGPSTFTCHICAIEVPSAFTEAHNASRKHKANASIMAAASERMRAMVIARASSRTPQPVGTYCDVCNTIAEKDHAKTANHKQAVRDEQLLAMLANLYCGGSDHDDDDDEEVSDNQDEIDNNKKTSDTKVNATEATNQVEVEKAVEDEMSTRKYYTDNNKDPSVGNSKTTTVAHQIDNTTVEENANKKQNEDGHSVDKETNSNSNRKQTELHKEGEQKSAAHFSIDESTGMVNNDNELKNKFTERAETSKTNNNKQYEDMMRDYTIQYENELVMVYGPQILGGTFNKNKASNNTNANAKSKNDTKPLPVTNTGQSQVNNDKEQISNKHQEATAHSGVAKETDKVNTNIGNTNTSRNDIKPDQNQLPISDTYDPKNDLFWSLVKRFKIEEPWRNRIMTIYPVGSKIQIYVTNEKVNVQYDNFHSFNRREGKCLVCMTFFDTYYTSEDHHIGSKKHMGRIMLPVNDSHCFRKIADWFHCILCNDTFPGHSEEQHKTSPAHRKNKLEATIPKNQITSTFEYNNPNTNPIEYNNPNTSQFVSNRYTETETRRKITIQKQVDKENRKVCICYAASGVNRGICMFCGLPRE